MSRDFVLVSIRNFISRSTKITLQALNDAEVSILLSDYFMTETFSLIIAFYEGWNKLFLWKKGKLKISIESCHCLLYITKYSQNINQNIEHTPAHSPFTPPPPGTFGQSRCIMSWLMRESEWNFRFISCSWKLPWIMIFFSLCWKSSSLNMN